MIPIISGMWCVARGVTSGRSLPKASKSSQKYCNEGRREFVDRDLLFRRFVDDAVVNVGKVENVRKFITFVFEVPPQNVAEDEGSKVADVGKIPDGGPAYVHPHDAFFKRMELLDGVRQRVVKLEHKRKQKFENVL